MDVRVGRGHLQKFRNQPPGFRRWAARASQCRCARGAGVPFVCRLGPHLCRQEYQGRRGRMRAVHERKPYRMLRLIVPLMVVTM